VLVSKQHFTFDRSSIPVTVSLGVALLATEHRGAADLVRAADEKLYEAKTSGRNCVCS
jgi:two-component system cell cycle response regulator